MGLRKQDKQSCFILILFSFFWGGGLYQWHMEIPRLGGPIGVTAVNLCHGHSNARSELHLRPVPQLVATEDP